jgi:hypothetical protein
MNPRETTTMGPRVSSDPIIEWRRGRLLDAGFASDLAADLAQDGKVDLHALLDLVDQGCPPDLAARILAPLEDHRRL